MSDVQHSSSLFRWSFFARDDPCIGWIDSVAKLDVTILSNPALAGLKLTKLSVRFSGCVAHSLSPPPSLCYFLSFVLVLDFVSRIHTL